MIKPGERLFHGLDGRRRRQRRSPQHDHRQAQCVRGGDLAVRRTATAVLRDENVDALLSEQHLLIGLGERSASGYVTGARYGERRIDGIDAADEVMVLRCAGKRRKLLAAEREKDPSRCRSEGGYRLHHIGDLGPAVAGDLTPGRPAQGDKRNPHLRNRTDGVRGDVCCIRMRCIDQRIDPLRPQIIGKALDAAKSPDPHRNGLRDRRYGPAGKRENDCELRTSGEVLGQPPRFRCAAENKDALHVAR